jgi:crossover junction endodeoxyribonuclease RuvC
MTLILGVDPSLSQTGWGIISYNNTLSFIDSGSIKTNPKEGMASRILSISNALQDVINSYKPNLCAIEETFVNKNPATSLKLGHARGAIMLLLSQMGISISEYAPNLIKKTIVGVGRAEKDQVAHMVKVLLPKAKFDNFDASDALAVAICHATHMKFYNKI